MMTFLKGERVSVLDEDFEGVVIAVDKDRITIETTDGFEMTYFVNQLIKYHNSNELRKSIGSVNFNTIKKEKEVERTRSFVKERKNKGEIPPPDFDLHIEKLVKNHRSMSNYDILTLQLETAKRHLDFAVRNRIPKIILIHGVGEGTLKSELDYLLGRYEGIDFREASYQKYGQGATEVIFRQR